jgi:hypothetical protein
MDPTPFLRDFQDGKKNYFFKYLFSLMTAGSQKFVLNRDIGILRKKNMFQNARTNSSIPFLTKTVSSE